MPAKTWNVNSGGKGKIKAFKGTVSLPFENGDNAKIAVKIIDDRNIESLRVISL